MDEPPGPAWRNPYIGPGILIDGVFIGVHRFALEDEYRQLRLCRQLSWDVCRMDGGPDIIFDEQAYVVALRFHRPGRGGLQFSPVLYHPRTWNGRWPEMIRWLGMTEAEYLATHPGHTDLRSAEDPDFGPLKIYVFDEIEFEFEQAGDKRVLGGILVK